MAGRGCGLVLDWWIGRIFRRGRSIIYFKNFPRRAENRVVELDIGDGRKVRVMNAVWLLKQKVIVWNESWEKEDREKRSLDLVDYKTIRDVVEMQGLKARFRGEGEIKLLRRFVMKGSESAASYRRAVDCPEVLRPWWKSLWDVFAARVVVYYCLVVCVGLLYDWATSDDVMQRSVNDWSSILREWGRELR